MNNTIIGVVEGESNSINLSGWVEDEEGDNLSYYIGNQVCCNTDLVGSTVDFNYVCSNNRDNENIASFLCVSRTEY